MGIENFAAERRVVELPSRHSLRLRVVIGKLTVLAYQRGFLLFADRILGARAGWAALAPDLRTAEVLAGLPKALMDTFLDDREAAAAVLACCAEVWGEPPGTLLRLVLPAADDAQTETEAAAMRAAIAAVVVDLTDWPTVLSGVDWSFVDDPPDEPASDGADASDEDDPSGSELAITRAAMHFGVSPQAVLGWPQEALVRLAKSVKVLDRIGGDDGKGAPSGPALVDGSTADLEAFGLQDSRQR